MYQSFGKVYLIHKSFSPYASTIPTIVGQVIGAMIVERHSAFVYR